MIVPALEILEDNTGEMTTQEYSKEECESMIRRCNDVIQVTGESSDEDLGLVAVFKKDVGEHWFYLGPDVIMGGRIMKQMFAERMVNNYPADDAAFKIFKERGRLDA